MLAYCLEYADGIAFSKGLAEPDEPPLAVRDLTGAMRVWIDIGAPDAARLHKAAEAAARVVVYTHKDPEKVMRQWSGERRMVFALSVTSGHLYVTIDGDVFDGAVERHALD